MRLQTAGVFQFGPHNIVETAKPKIKLSQNELWSLLTKVFEALYGHRRDYYDMARTVFWLECNGHEGVRQLIDALPLLGGHDYPKPEWREISSSQSIFDCGGRSLFCIGRTIFDLAMAAASQTEKCEISIMNAAHPKALIGLMPYASRQGFAAGVLWSEGGAVIRPDTDYPRIYTCEVEHSLSVICSHKTIDIKTYLGTKSSVSKKIEAQTECVQICLERGLRIAVEDYEVLNAVANRVLVEATEVSRRGAGE